MLKYQEKLLMQYLFSIRLSICYLWWPRQVWWCAAVLRWVRAGQRDRHLGRLPGRHVCDVWQCLEWRVHYPEKELISFECLPTKFCFFLTSSNITYMFASRRPTARITRRGVSPCTHRQDFWQYNMTSSWYDNTKCQFMPIHDSMTPWWQWQEATHTSKKSVEWKRCWDGAWEHGEYNQEGCIVGQHCLDVRKHWW